MSKKAKNLAFDFDGVLSVTPELFQDGAFIVTGRNVSENDEILETLGEKKASGIYNFPHVKGEVPTDVQIGVWKARVLKKLMVAGVEKFYEDSSEQIEIIQEINPKLEVVRVLDGVPQEKLNFIIFYHSNTPILSIAHKLEKEGNRVILATIEDSKKILLPEELKGNKPEDPKEEKLRMSLYDGIIEKYSADEVLKIAKRIKDKENWIVLTDSNSNFQYAEKMLEMGFTKGMFPLQEDREMESDRKKAKDFVREHYPEIKVAEVKTFKTIEEGIAFLNESEDLWVLKSCGDAGTTICPATEDPEIACTEIIAALEEMQSDYEENGFLLEPRILEPIELTPEMTWISGAPIFSFLDIEIKTIAGGSAIQTGCVLMLAVKTELEDRINKIAFPPIIHEMAKKRTGTFVYDLSILIDKKGVMWFGEYCSMRKGYDSWTVELAMSSDDEGAKVVTPYFSSLLYKKNPLRKRYGVGVRLLNIGNGGKMVDEGTVEVACEAEKNTYLFEVKKKDDKLISTTYCYDFAVVTSSCDDLQEAVEECYEAVDKVMFEGKYFRTREDFESYGYSASILRRLNYALEHGFISGGDENSSGMVGQDY